MTNNLREWIKARQWRDTSTAPLDTAVHVLLFDEILKAIKRKYEGWIVYYKGSWETLSADQEPNRWTFIPDTDTSDILAQFDALQAKADLVDEMVQALVDVVNNEDMGDVIFTAGVYDNFEDIKQALAKYEAIMEGEG